MGRQIIKQPNGKYAVWSTTVTDFVLLDVTPTQIVNLWVEEERDKISKRVLEVVMELEKGRQPYFQSTKTWDEACAFAKKVHGPFWKPGEGS